MIIPNTKRTIVGIVILLSLLIVIAFTIQQTHADSDDVFEVSAAWDTPHTKVSESEYGARKPVISASQVSNRVLVVYDHWTGGDALTDKDPYYAFSTNGGTTWPVKGQPIFTSSNGSNQTVGLLDYQDTAFAIWIESNPNVFSTLTFAQMPVNGSWSAAQNIFPTIPFLEGQIFDPYVTVDSNNTLHVVWSQLKNDPYGINIYYASRPQGGSWSTPVRINNTAPPSREPSIAVDSNSNLHIVWEESTLDGTEIRYSSGVVSANNFVVGSANYVKLSPDEMDEAVLPIIHVSDGKMQIMYTNILSQSSQNVYFGSCSLPCSGFNSGVFKSVTSFVSVNGNNPFNLVADLDYSAEKNASFIYFHGAQDTDANEAVMGRSSCSGWSGAKQDNVTDPTPVTGYRAIEPSISIKGNTMHLAYDRIEPVTSGFDHQIYVTKSLIDCESFVYLPIIER